MMRSILGVAFSLLLTTAAFAQPAVYPTPVEGDFIARDFVFTSGERMAEVKIHYRTIGTPRKDADGVARNGVMILHGTGGTGAGFLGRTYGGLLFGKGSRSTRRSSSSSCPTTSATGGRASRATACA
jgi:homoserine O-acetyltransferase